MFPANEGHFDPRLGHRIDFGSENGDGCGMRSTYPESLITAIEYFISIIVLRFTVRFAAHAATAIPVFDLRAISPTKLVARFTAIRIE
jgi:hypothetical protein